MESICRIYENFLLNKLGILNEGTTDGSERGPNERRTVEYQLEDILRFVD
jgi:hypothetical protein